MVAMEDALLFVVTILLSACPIEAWHVHNALKRKCYCSLIRAAASGLVCGFLAWLKSIEQRALVITHSKEGYSGRAIQGC